MSNQFPRISNLANLGTFFENKIAKPDTFVERLTTDRSDTNWDFYSTDGHTPGAPIDLAQTYAGTEINGSKEAAVFERAFNDILKV
jgi:hypothetical protein